MLTLKRYLLSAKSCLKANTESIVEWHCGAFEIYRYLQLYKAPYKGFPKDGGYEKNDLVIHVGVFSGVGWCRSVFYSHVHDIIIENFISLNFNLTIVSFDAALQLVLYRILQFSRLKNDLFQPRLQGEKKRWGRGWICLTFFWCTTLDSTAGHPSVDECTECLEAEGHTESALIQR